jgi:hypothetical protein
MPMCLTGFTEVSDATTLKEFDNVLLIRRSADSFRTTRPAWQQVRSWYVDNQKRYLPYHPVVRFRRPRIEYVYPVLNYARRFEGKNLDCRHKDQSCFADYFPVESRKCRGLEPVELKGELKNAYRIFIVKSGRTGPVVRLSRKWDDII